jgi:putative alpha-1,2-mannosidase
MAYCLLLTVTAQTPKDYTRYINPFIGTGGHGHTFPGATMPFGMVQLSPDTRIDNWDGSSGYHYSDNEIFGFSHTHLSGTGIPDYCDILLMPTVGEVDFGNFKSTFSHTNEKAEPGYYSVKMDNGVTAELTATTRVGLHRYTFPKSDKANIVLDLKWRDKVLDSSLKIVGNNRVEGFRRSSSWAKDQIIYFAIEFSKPIFSFVSDSGLKDFQQTLESQKPEIIALPFKTSQNEQILVKVGISAVSIEGARKNLQAELPHWNFEKVRNDAKAAWNKELSQIEITDDNQENLTKFYTALYHTKIQPNIFSDVDGNYRGMDKKIHNLKSPQPSALSTQHYTVFSLWDTFRAAHPLYTIIDQKRTVDFINTFIRQYEQGGRLPVWELAGNETDTMIGYHAVSVIADAMAKGIKGFNYEKAYEAAKHSAELNHFGLEGYKKRGYISMEDENESVSKTLEYAYNDYCIAVMAKILLLMPSKQRENEPKAFIESKGVAHLPLNVRKTEIQKDFARFLKRSQYYKNLFDAETGFMRPRQNGGWISPFKPNEVTFHFTEGNSWVYSFFVPHDVDGLIELHGGKANFAQRLSNLFDTEDKLEGRFQPDITGLIGQYAHGNEPSHHIAYLFNYVGQPWRTQELVRQINDEFYKNAPDGLIGNEDCGQMSTWFILSSLGFYQVNPSVPNYDLGTPLFKEAKINLENGKSFVIKAPNVSDKNFYVKSVKLNGKDYHKTFFNHSDIKNGGTLEFEMTDKPNETAFSKFSKSSFGESNFVSVPLIQAKDRVFKGSTNVSLNSISKDAKILYSIDGNEPNLEYKQPFTIDKSAIIKAVAVNSKGEKSHLVEAKLFKLPHDWTVKLFANYSSQYTGGGAQGLIDGIRGTTNFASGEWQGYRGEDFVAVIDLQRETEIKRVGGGFLQNVRSWIWMPTRIEFETSTDGQNFTKVAEIQNDVPPEEMKEQFKDYKTQISPIRARYVRVKAVNFGKIPAWHPGTGETAWLFVDEIFVE